jgi:hypothetical protein
MTVSYFNAESAEIARHSGRAGRDTPFDWAGLHSRPMSRGHVPRGAAFGGPGERPLCDPCDLCV